MAIEKCSQCGFVLQPLESSCPRCKLAATSSAKTTSGTAAPTTSAPTTSATHSGQPKPVAKPIPVKQTPEAPPLQPGAPGNPAAPASVSAKAASAQGATSKGSTHRQAAAPAVGFLTALRARLNGKRQQRCTSCQGSFPAELYVCPHCAHRTAAALEETRGLSLEQQRTLMGYGMSAVVLVVFLTVYWSWSTLSRELSYRILGRTDLHLEIETRVPAGKNQILQTVGKTSYWSRPGYLRILTESADQPAGHGLTRILDYEGRSLATVDQATKLYYKAPLDPAGLREQLYPSRAESTPRLSRANAGRPPGVQHALWQVEAPAGFRLTQSQVQVQAPALAEPGTVPSGQESKPTANPPSRKFRLQRLGRETILGVRTVHLRLTTQVVAGSCPTLKDTTEVVDLWVASRLPRVSLEPTPTPVPQSPEASGTGQPDTAEDPDFAKPTPEPGPAETPAPVAPTPDTEVTSSTAVPPPTQASPLPDAAGTPTPPPTPPPTQSAPTPGSSGAPAPDPSPTPLRYPTPYPGPIPDGVLTELARHNHLPEECDPQETREGNSRDYERLVDGLVLRMRIFKDGKVVLEQEAVQVEEVEIPRQEFSTDAFQLVTREEFWVRREAELANPSPTSLPTSAPLEPNSTNEPALEQTSPQATELPAGELPTGELPAMGAAPAEAPAQAPQPPPPQ